MRNTISLFLISIIISYYIQQLDLRYFIQLIIQTDPQFLDDLLHSNNYSWGG